MSRCSEARARRHAPWFQLCVGLLCSAVAWTPWALAWGDEVRASASAGGALGASLAEQFKPRAGSTAGLPTLFPGSSGDSASFSSLYGNDSRAIAVGEQWQRDLLNSSSFQGKAYQALRGPLNRARPDFRDDPIWRNTDYVLDNFAELSRDFADCETVTRFTQSDRDAKISDIRVCERVRAINRQCDLSHSYSLPGDQVPLTVGNYPATVSGRAERAVASVENAEAALAEAIAALEDVVRRSPSQRAWTYNCGADVAGCAIPNCLSGDCLDARLEVARAQESLGAARNAVGPALSQDTEIAYINSDSCSDGNYTFSVTHPEKIISIRGDVSTSLKPPEGSAFSFGIVTGIRLGKNTKTVPVSDGLADLTREIMDTGAVSMRDYDNGTYYQAVNNSVTTFSLYDRPFCAKLRLQVEYWPITAAADDVWSGGSCWEEVRGYAGSPFCAVSTECTDMPTPPAGGCHTAVGVRICGDDLAAPPTGDFSRWCRRAEVRVKCDEFNQGAGSCWIDPQGQRQCIANSGGEHNCEDLENNPNCGFLRTQCVEGASDAFGNCFVEEEIWDCGAGVGIPTLTRDQEHNCAGAVRCMGTDCASFPGEQSQDFGKAVAALQALQMMLLDMQCSDEECVIFAGEDNECKKAVGGVVDCCEGPEAGVGLGEYITLILAASKIENAMGLGVTDQVRGAWEVLTGPVDSMWSAVQQSFTSVANSLTGSTTAAASDAAAVAGFDGVKQQLMNSVAGWTRDVFGQPAAETLFQSVNGGPLFGNGGTLLADAQLTSFLTTAMQAVLWAYMIYNVAMILVRLIWTCEEEELELNAKRELRTCHFVGGYCKDEILGWCIEKRDAFCCFNSPIARILNEQIRPQLGRAWGTPKRPDCDGIAVRDLARVDWSQVDLDEWLAMLMDSGNFPTADRLNLDDLTGGGHLYAVDDRPNVQARTVARSDGLDAEDLREQASAEIEDEILPTVPDGGSWSHTVALAGEGVRIDGADGHLGITPANGEIVVQRGQEGQAVNESSLIDETISGVDIVVTLTVRMPPADSATTDDGHVISLLAGVNVTGAGDAVKVSWGRTKDQEVTTYETRMVTKTREVEKTRIVTKTKIEDQLKQVAVWKNTPQPVYYTRYFYKAWFWEGPREASAEWYGQYCWSGYYKGWTAWPCWTEPHISHWEDNWGWVYEWQWVPTEVSYEEVETYWDTETYEEEELFPVTTRVPGDYYTEITRAYAAGSSAALAPRNEAPAWSDGRTYTLRLTYGRDAVRLEAHSDEDPAFGQWRTVVSASAPADSPFLPGAVGLSLYDMGGAVVSGMTVMPQ